MDILNDDGGSRSSISMTVANAATGNRQTRLSSVINSNYEQVSIKEIVSRFKDKSHKRRTSVKIEDEVLSEADDIEERIEYYLEAPKTGLLDKHEIIQPLFLPTACEMALVNQAAATSTVSAVSRERNTRKFEEIRNLVYCQDPKIIDDYQNRLQSKGVAVKQHFGLSFDSDFECGNLFQAESVVRKGAPLGAPEEYDLFLRMDPSSNAVLYSPCAQWFFFRIENTKKRSYQFNIHFLSNEKIAYQDGKRPMMISEADFNGMDKEGWKPCGADIIFEESYQRPLMYKCREEYPVLEGPTRPSLYKLSFTFTCKHPKDTLYFAYDIPYTFTQLQNFIYVLSKNPFNRRHLQIRTLCRSLAGNRTDVLVITEDSLLTRHELLERDVNGDLINVPYSIKDVLPSTISALSGAPTAMTGAASNRPGTAATTVSCMTSATHISATSFAPMHARNLFAAKSDAAKHQGQDVGDIPDGEQAIPRFFMKLQNELEEQKEKDRRLRIEKARKPAVVMLGRLHPNETCSSWICEGIIRYLLSENITAKLLRERFAFYIVPMMNIDGVVNGYSRHDIAGYDLATQWVNPSPVLHPSLFAVKKILRKLKSTTTIAGLFDIRGHSHRTGFSFHTQLSALRNTYSSPAKVGSSSSSHSPVHNHSHDSHHNSDQFDPRTFYYAAARRCKYVALKHCHVMRYVPHYPQVGETLDQFHNEHHKNELQNNVQLSSGKRAKWWQVKDSTARMVATHHLQVGLSVTVEASTYRSAASSTHVTEIKYLSPTDYAVFGSQLCLSLIDMYLAKDPEVQSRLSNSSFIIHSSSSNRRKSTEGSNHHLQNIADIIQHLPAMLDEDDDLEEDCVVAKQQQQPTAAFETTTVDSNHRARRPRYRNSTINRISFNIGSSDVDENLKRISAADSASMGDSNDDIKNTRKSETVDFDKDDMQRVDYFNEDLWEHDSQASSDGDVDHGDAKQLFSSALCAGGNSLSHLQPVHADDHQDTCDPQSDLLDRLSYLSFQSHDVVQRTIPFLLHAETEYPPSRWCNIRRAEYLGLIAPKSEKEDSELQEEDDSRDKRSSATATAPGTAILTNTEHVFRMGPAASSFKPVKVMEHSERLVAAITEKQQLQMQIQQQLQASADLSSLAQQVENEYGVGGESSVSLISGQGNRVTHDFDDEDDEDDVEQKRTGIGSRSNKRNNFQKSKKSLIQFSYSKSAMQKTAPPCVDKGSADSKFDSDSKDESKLLGATTAEESSQVENIDLAPAVSVKAAMQRIGQFRQQRKSQANNSTGKMESPSPHAKGRSTISVLFSGTPPGSNNSDSVMAGNNVIDLPNVNPIPPEKTSPDKGIATISPRFRHKTTNTTVASTIVTASATTIGSSEHSLSLVPVAPVATQPYTEQRPKVSTTVVLQRVPIVKDDGEEDLDVSQETSSPQMGSLSKLRSPRKTLGKQQSKDKKDTSPLKELKSLASIARNSDTDKSSTIHSKNLSWDNISLSSSVAEADLPLMQIDFSGAEGLPIPAEVTVLPAGVEMEMPKSMPQSLQLSFTDQLKQIICKAAEETPAPAFSPLDTVLPQLSTTRLGVSSPEEDSSRKRVLLTSSNVEVTGAASPAVKVLIPFVNDALNVSIPTPSKVPIQEETNSEAPLIQREVPSIAYSAYPGDLPAGYTPQKRKGRRASAMITAQYGAESDMNMVGSNSVVTENIPFSSPIVIAQQLLIDTTASKVVEPPTERITNEFVLADTTSNSETKQDELAAQRPLKKRQLEGRNPLLLHTYENVPGSITSKAETDASINAEINVDTDADADSETNPVENAVEPIEDIELTNSLPPLPSLSELSDAQFQRAIAFASLNQQRKLELQDEIAKKSALVLPFVSLNTFVPSSVMQHLSKSIPRGQKVPQGEQGPTTGGTDAGADEEVEKHLAILGPLVQKTDPRAPNPALSMPLRDYAFLRGITKRELGQTMDFDDDLQDEEEGVDEDEDAYDYDPHDPRGGGSTRDSVHPGIIVGSNSARYRKRRVQIIREYLQQHFEHSNTGDAQHDLGNDSTSIINTSTRNTAPASSTASTAPELYDRSIVNEEGHRVHFLAGHQRADQGAYGHQSPDEKQSSLVAASLQEWRDHHHIPLSKSLAISFISPATGKHNALDLEAQKRREAEQKCLRQLGLTYDYMFGGIGALKSRPPPDVMQHKSPSLSVKNTTLAQEDLACLNQSMPNNANHNIVTSSEQSLLSLPYPTANTSWSKNDDSYWLSASLPPDLTQKASVMHSTERKIDDYNHRPLGPRGTFHKGFPQRGGSHRRYEMSYATDSAAYRLHAYYQHILHELQRRNLVSNDALESTATQLFETVLTDPLHRHHAQQSHVSSLRFHDKVSFTSEAGMAVSLTVIPPAKQLTPFRRYVKRPVLTRATNASQQRTAGEESQHGRTSSVAMRRSKQMRSLDDELSEMLRSQALQERLHTVAKVQAEQALALQKEQDIISGPDDKNNQGIPEWLSLSPRLRHRFVVGHAVDKGLSPNTASSESKFPWFHATTSKKTVKNNATLTKNADELERASSSTVEASRAPYPARSIQEAMTNAVGAVQTEELSKKMTTSFVFDDEDERTGSANRVSLDDTGAKKQQKSSKRSIPKKAKAPVKVAAVQTMQLFSGFDILVPPVQLTTMLTTEKSVPCDDGSQNNTFQDRIRQKLLTKYRSHQEQQQQFQRDRHLGLFGAHPGDENDPIKASETSASSNDRNHAEVDETNAVTVKSLLEQQEYLTAGEVSFAPIRTTTTNTSATAMKNFSFVNALKADLSSKQQSLDSSSWLRQHGGKSLWEITQPEEEESVTQKEDDNKKPVIKSRPLSPLKLGVVSFPFTDPLLPARATSPLLLPEKMKLLLERNTDMLRQSDATSGGGSHHNNNQHEANSHNNTCVLDSAGSDKPMTPHVGLPPAHTPPVTGQSSTGDTQEQLTLLLATKVALSPRISDIQRLTASMMSGPDSVNATPSQLPSSSVSRQKKTLSLQLPGREVNPASDTAAATDPSSASAVAIEVAARRPGGKKILLVQKQQQPLPLSSSHKHTIQQTILPQTLRDTDDAGEDFDGSNVVGGDREHNSYRHQQPKHFAVRIIRAAASIDPLEKERNRAGAIGRLLVGSNPHSHSRQQHQLSPSKPESSTTTITVTVTAPNTGTPNNHPTMSVLHNMIPVRPSMPPPSQITTEDHSNQQQPNHPIRQKKSLKKHKQEAQQLIDQLRQATITK
jgi:hypothetical protein